MWRIHIKGIEPNINSFNSNTCSSTRVRETYDISIPIDIHDLLSLFLLFFTFRFLFTVLPATPVFG